MRSTFHVCGWYLTKINIIQFEITLKCLQAALCIGGAAVGAKYVKGATIHSITIRFAGTKRITSCIIATVLFA